MKLFNERSATASCTACAVGKILGSCRWPHHAVFQQTRDVHVISDMLMPTIDILLSRAAVGNHTAGGTAGKGLAGEAASAAFAIGQLVRQPRGSEGSSSGRGGTTPNEI
mmetsp:Transcript_16068/g.34055  ORF Transcript_16068/g.34055 Transcript_16068/m.34055 type:complete len:109 (+) Transcript_16068:96-422(+)